MPTNFERARDVVEQLLPIAAELVKGSVDELIGRRLADLRSAYNGQLLKDNRPAIDYSMLTTKIGYVYRSLPAHADWLYQALCLAPKAVTAALSQRRVSIACVGGGPGSDVLGVVKFLEQRGIDRPSLKATVLDYDPRWHRVRERLFESFDFQLKQHVAQHLDISKDDDWTPSWGFLDADILTFSFCLSEFWSFNVSGGLSRFLDRTLSGLRPGSLVVYVDNGGPEFCARMEQEFDRDDLRCVVSRDVERLFMGFDERRDVIEDAYKARFRGEWTKVQGNVSMRIWKKL